MKWKNLIRALEADRESNPFVLADKNADPEITGVFYSSAKVIPGGLFVAIPGNLADGHDYISDALERGAAVVVAQRPVNLPVGKNLVVAADSRRALGALAAEFSGHPDQEMTLIGVTGTNGKTTVCWLIESILKSAGLAVGVLGTVSVRYADKVVESPVTTPESADLFPVLADMKDAGVTHVVMEVSSHALDQGRVRFCSLDTAVFTNCSQDHLDYHQDMESYFLCKRGLFLETSTRGIRFAVINADDLYGARLCGEVKVPMLCTGVADACQVRGMDPRISSTGIYGLVETPRGTVEVDSPLAGRHNFYNILSAVGVAEALELDLGKVQAGINQVERIPGRLERVENNQGRDIYVDYAHTPQALEKVLESLKKIATGRIITVMGAGGDRDQSKRVPMGEAAARYSDLVVITSDNPRSENPAAIIEQVEKGVRSLALPATSLGQDAGGYLVEPDRKKAIVLAVTNSREGDTVLIAGKGHENYQIVGKRKRFFDDCLEAREALELLAEYERP